MALYQSKDQPASVAAFEQAFKIESTYPNDLDNGACAAALAGKPDRALAWLQKAAELGLANPQHLQADADLISLHDLPPWPAIVAAVQKNRSALDAKIDKPLRAELRAIRVSSIRR